MCSSSQSYELASPADCAARVSLSAMSGSDFRSSNPTRCRTAINANKTHETTVNTSEMNRQVAVDKAIKVGGGSTVVQAAIKTAEIAHYRTCVASCLANGNLESSWARQALWELGTGGT
jgi:hypothetical protein